MKNKDLYDLKNAILKISDLGGGEFVFKMVKNLKIIEKEIEILETIIKPTKDYEERYQPEMMKIVLKYCVKDNNGNPILQNNDNKNTLYTIPPEERINFERDVMILNTKKEWIDIVKYRKEQEKKLEEALEMNINISFIKVKKEDIPKDIKIGELYGIYSVLEEL